MGTIAEKLQKLLDTKNAIKNAIIAKGQEIGETDTFASYADKIVAIETTAQKTAAKVTVANKADIAISICYQKADLETDLEYIQIDSGASVTLYTYVGAVVYAYSAAGDTPVSLFAKSGSCNYGGDNSTCCVITEANATISCYDNTDWFVTVPATITIMVPSNAAYAIDVYAQPSPADLPTIYCINPGDDYSVRSYVGGIVYIIPGDADATKVARFLTSKTTHSGCDCLYDSDSEPYCGAVLVTDATASAKATTMILD